MSAPSTIETIKASADTSFNISCLIEKDRSSGLYEVFKKMFVFWGDHKKFGPIGPNLVISSSHDLARTGEVFKTSTHTFSAKDFTQDNLADWATAIYRRVCTKSEEVLPMHFPGNYRDLMKIEILKSHDEDAPIYHARALEIYQIGYNLIKSASDCAVFIKGKNADGKEKAYVVLIVRKFEPGKGRPATIGGFRDVGSGDPAKEFDPKDPLNGTCGYAQAPAYAAVNEVAQEALSEVGLPSKASGKPGLYVEPSLAERLKTDHNITSFEATFKTKTKNHPVTVQKAGVFNTSMAKISEGGERRDDNELRVHEAHAFLATINYKETLPENEEGVKALFCAGDDAQDMYVKDVSDLLEKPPVEAKIDAHIEAIKPGILHHRDILKVAMQVFSQNQKTVDKEAKPSFSFSKIFSVIFPIIGLLKTIMAFIISLFKSLKTKIS